MAERDIDLLLLTGAGASYALGASGARIAAMKDWSDQLTSALMDRNPGYVELTGLQYKLDAAEFEARLGKFITAARAFGDAHDLMTATSNLVYPSPVLQNLMRRDNVEDWHQQVSHHIEEVFDVINESLYGLFGNPAFDYQRACTSYAELLDQIAIAPGSARWVYATTNYDKVGDEALEGAGFPIAWGERPRARGGDRLINPAGLLDGVRTTVPVLHLHGRIGWYRRSENEGGAAYAGDIVQHQKGFGTPIVMLPSPSKAYDADPVINAIWEQFGRALERAKRVLVLGHSLNDSQIVDAIAELADPASVAVTVYGHRSDPGQPEWNEDPVLAIREERLPDSTLVPIRFGETGMPRATKLDDWLSRSG